MWSTRDERARDGEVLHPQGVCVINPASTRGTVGVRIPGELKGVQVAGLAAIAGPRRETRRQQRPPASGRHDTDSAGSRASDGHVEGSRGPRS